MAPDSTHARVLAVGGDPPDERADPSAVGAALISAASRIGPRAPGVLHAGDAQVAALHVEVAVPVPIAKRLTFTYRVPPALVARATIGSRVLVRFGTRKLTGVIVREHVEPPAGVKTIDLSEVLDDTPALPKDLVLLCQWIADYYEAPLGEVMRAALPAGSAVGARPVYGLTAAGRTAAGETGAALPGKQRAVLARLLLGDIPLAAAKSDKAVLAALAEQGLVETREQRAKARTKLPTERTAQLAVPLAQAREAVGRSPKKYAVIDALASGDVIALADLEKQVSKAGPALRELAKDGLIALATRELPLEAALTGGEDLTSGPPPELTDEQTLAVREITAALAGQSATEVASPVGHDVRGTGAVGHDSPATEVVVGHDAPPRGAVDPPKSSVFLLHGVTGSGKTEVYLRVIAEALERGQTALVLVPEISLTPQLAARFRARFGDQVAILHSGLPEQARLGEWSRLRRGEAKIAVGARSAVFAPVSKLGVIVIDEEHDGSYKQDEGVRYHARDVALVRAQRAGAVCVLGSATPSLESAALATGSATQPARYRKLSLTERPVRIQADGSPALPRPMPTVEIVDLKTYRPDGDAMLSAPLRVAIGEALAAGDQIILFLNRRGFATFVLCTACGHSFRCLNCSVSMTYHRHSDRLSCHYCNRTERVPETCPKCQSTGSIDRKGLGTEKVAEAVAAEFPTARVARLDRDVASGARAEVVLSRVARREVDVLVGTQMVTKGHDFPGVTLVGVLCADTGLSLPDFRASERTFQLLAQVAGRAGRGDRPGRVLIQTYRPDAHAVVAAAAHDYAGFFTAEMAARAELGYPPHGRLVAVRVDGSNAHEVAGTAQRLAQLAMAWSDKLAPEGSDPLQPLIDVRGPVPAPIEKLRGRTRWQVWLRSADRHALRRVARGLLSAEIPSAVRVVLDVDPLSAM